MAEISERLQQEIAILQKWLERQRQEGTFKGLTEETVPLVPIVEAMIESRRAMLSGVAPTPVGVDDGVLDN